jgi:hypothetical protein
MKRFHVHIAVESYGPLSLHNRRGSVHPMHPGAETI